ncbi:MAG: hypothetical protein NVS4B8_12280 [Herpetosiphon sp.]
MRLTLQLPVAGDLPLWAVQRPCGSNTRTAGEWSTIITAQPPIPATAQTGRQYFQSIGPLVRSLSGVRASAKVPLTAVQTGLVVTATYATDYLFVKHHDLPRATEVLIASGHEVLP